MNTKHTPGPWTVNANGINSPDGHIVFFDVSGGPHETDARLIAAAPELLEALEKLEQTASFWKDMGVNIPFDDLKQARVAIAKATKP